MPYQAVGCGEMSDGSSNKSRRNHNARDHRGHGDGAYRQKPLKRCDFSAPLTAIAYATRVFDMGVIAPDGQAPKSNRIGNAKMHSRSPIGFDASGREAAQ